MSEEKDVPDKAEYNTCVLELRLLGTFEITIDGTPAMPLRAQVSSWLLALLALKSGKPLDREGIAATLWPDSSHEQARYNLRRNLTDLRRVLGPEAIRLSSPTPQSIALDLTGAFCDLVAFDNAITEARWDDAIELYGGPFLSRGDAVWILEERERREISYRNAQEASAAVAIQRGDLKAAIEGLRTILVREPTRESAVRTLMTALVSEGNRAEALLVYRDLRLYLHEQRLGQPSSDTTALYETMRALSAAAGKPAMPAPSYRRLPLPLTVLRGREAELIQVEALLARNRWLTLIGMGGIGKTRLALEVGRNVSWETHFIELASLTNGELLAATIRQALYISQESDLATGIGEAEYLLILDNCEHLLEPIGDLIQELLMACPNLRLLLTSREPVGGAAEILFRVAALQEDAAWQLFMERVHAASPGYQHSEGLSELCRSLDGWPLALELAAAQVRSLPPAEIVKRVRLITPSRRVAPPRQRSLQATLDWSWELLLPQERVGIRRLSCFAGGWTLHAAETVCGALPETLAGLVDKSLVEFHGKRYSFREPIREYIAEQWSDHDEQERIQEEHGYYFLDLARQGDSQSHEGGIQAVRRLLVPEQENLRLILGRGGGIALQLACALAWYWTQQDQAREGQYWLERLLLQHTEANLLRVRGLRHAGIMAAGRFEWQRAYERAKEAVALCRHLQDTAPEPDIDSELLGSLSLVGSALNNIGHHAQAREVFVEMLARYRQNGNTIAEACTLEDLGFADRNLGDFVSAERWLTQALHLYRQQKDEERVISALGQLAMTHGGRGDLAGAANLLREVLAGYQRLGRGQAIGWTLCCLGVIERQLSELATAREHITEALERFRDAGGNLAWPLLELGRVALKEGEVAEADSLLQQARIEAIAGGAETLVQQIDREGAWRGEA